MPTTALAATDAAHSLERRRCRMDHLKEPGELLRVPAERTEPCTAAPGRDRRRDVGNGVFRKVIGGDPPELVALPGLKVAKLAVPTVRCEKEVDPLAIGSLSVHHTSWRERVRIELDPAFLERLATHRRRHRLTAVDVTGDHAVLSVFVASVVTTDQQDVISTRQEEVDSHRNGNPVRT